MTVGELVVVISNVVPILQKEGIMDAKGNITNNSPEAYASVAADIEAEVAKFVAVPTQVDKVIKSLPLILGLFTK